MRVVPPDVWRCWCSGCWSRLLCVPVGGGPPASRPRCELRSARRLEARPGPATAHRHCGRSLRRPPHQWGLVAGVWLGAPSRSLALPPLAATAARPSDWLLGAQGVCKPRGAPVSGGVCVLDRLRSHSERHNLSRLLSSIRIGSLPATVRLEPRGARGMSPCEAS